MPRRSRDYNPFEEIRYLLLSCFRRVLRESEGGVYPRLHSSSLDYFAESDEYRIGVRLDPPYGDQPIYFSRHLSPEFNLDRYALREIGQIDQIAHLIYSEEIENDRIRRVQLAEHELIISLINAEAPDDIVQTALSINNNRRNHIIDNHGVIESQEWPQQTLAISGSEDLQITSAALMPSPQRLTATEIMARADADNRQLSESLDRMAAGNWDALRRAMLQQEYNWSEAFMGGSTTTGGSLTRRLEDDADERSIELLKNHLSDCQREQFDKHRYFEVVGSDSGKVYRINHGRQMNVVELDKHNGRPLVGRCFLPSGDIGIGDVMLGQKIMLETSEKTALKISNKFTVDLSVGTV